MKIPKYTNDDRWNNCLPESEELMKKIGRRVTVCELLREIYNKTEDPEIKMNCRMATTMAKFMAHKISEYEGHEWGKIVYPWNPNLRQEKVKAKYDLPIYKGKT